MPSGFKTFGEEEFDRVFMKETEIIDNFVGTRLWTTGLANLGVMGNGTTTEKSSPGTTAGGGTNWKFVNAGAETTCGIKTDGTIWGWGRDQYGALGTNALVNPRTSPISIFSGIVNTWKTVSTSGTSVAIGD